MVNLCDSYLGACLHMNLEMCTKVIFFRKLNLCDSYLGACLNMNLEMCAKVIFFKKLIKAYNLFFWGCCVRKFSSRNFFP